MAIWQIFVVILVILATFMTVATVILQLRAPNALTRANLLGPLTSIAFPLLIVAKLTTDWVTDGFDLNNFLRAIVAILGVWIVVSVGSFVMGRSIYGVTVSDPRAAQARNSRQTGHDAQGWEQ